jgi:hypothetical protein
MGLKNKQYIFCFLIIGLVVCVLSGCASAPIDLSKTKSLPERESVVFGRVNLLLGGNPVIWRRAAIPQFIGHLFVLSTGSSNAVIYDLADDGTFYWHLPPGDYAIAAIQFILGGRSINGRIFAEFRVPEARSIIYIGKLTLIFSGSRFHMNIEDDYDQEIQKFKDMFPEIKGEFIKDLMKLEKPK